MKSTMALRTWPPKFSIGIIDGSGRRMPPSELWRPSAWTKKNALLQHRRRFLSRLLSCGLEQQHVVSLGIVKDGPCRLYMNEFLASNCRNRGLEARDRKEQDCLIFRG